MKEVAIEQEARRELAVLMAERDALARQVSELTLALRKVGRGVNGTEVVGTHLHRVIDDLTVLAARFDGVSEVVTVALAATVPPSQGGDTMTPI